MHFAIAILLAAGASTRMHAVKALQPVDQQPAVRYLALQLRSISQRCVVVVGYHATKVQAVVSGLDNVILARNPHPEHGQLSSLQCGLRAACSVGAEWYLFTPVDWMGIGQQVLLPLLEGMQAASTGDLLCIPECRGRRGHPVAFRSELAEKFLHLPPGSTARDIVHRHRAQTRFVPVADDSFLSDINTPRDYQQFVARRSRLVSGSSAETREGRDE